MLIKKGEGEKMRYCCGTYIRMGKKYCTPHTVRYTELKEILSRDLEKIFPDILNEWNKQKEHILREKEKKEELLKEHILDLKKKQKENDCKNESSLDNGKFVVEEWMKRAIILELIEEIKVEEKQIEIIYRFCQ